MNSVLRIVALSASTGLLLLATAGCSPEIKDYCADLVACERGNEYDENACVEGLETQQDISDVYGCQTEYDTWLTCESANVVCVPQRSLKSTTGEDFEFSGGSDDEMALSSGTACSTYHTNWARCMEAADANWD